MGRGRPWNPWLHLRDQHPDVRVFEVELQPPFMGCVDHHERIIWLDSRLTDAEMRCTLGHELGHLELDVVTEDGRVMPASEWRVDQWAAERLICTSSLVAAFGWSTYLSEIAEELRVDERTLRVRLRGMTDEEQDQVMAAIRKLVVMA